MTPTPTPHRPRTLSIGGATYDLFVRTGSSNVVESNGASELRLPLGAKIPLQGVIETCGGGAANTSVGLKRLGCDSGFCGIIGSDQWGDRLLKNFAEEGVDMSAMTVIEKEMTSFSLILSASSGERVILYESGTNAHMHDSVFDKSAAFSCDWIFLNHIHDRSCIIEDDLLEILLKTSPLPSPAGRGQRNLSGDSSFSGPGLSWNPGGCHIEKGIHEERTQKLLAATDLLFLNREEALTFTSAKTDVEALHMLLKAGVATVCITDGPRGAMASDGTKLYRCAAAEQSEIVDTTGAGDAFGTGVTWAKLQSMTLPEMLRAGTINALSVLGSFGAQKTLLTETEMHIRIGQHPLPVEVLDFPSFS